MKILPNHGAKDTKNGWINHLSTSKKSSSQLLATNGLRRRFCRSEVADCDVIPDMCDPAFGGSSSLNHGSRGEYADGYIVANIIDSVICDPHPPCDSPRGPRLFYRSNFGYRCGFGLD